MMGRVSGCALAVAILTVAPGAVSGQSLEQRVDEARADRISFRYETHDDVQRCGSGWSRGGGTWNRGDCWSGPAEVILERRGREIRSLDVEIVREGAAAPRGTMDLGTVAPAEVADFLLDLVSAARPSVSEDAIGAAVMARDVVLWPRLLDFARSPELDREVRQSATFWLGQASADEALDGLVDIVGDDPDTEVKASAVFAISQRDSDQAVPILMEIAEGHAEGEVRRSAFFWLSQHDDDARVVDFFEKVLRGSG